MTSHEQSVLATPAASTALPSAKVIHLPRAQSKRVQAGTFTKSTVARMHCAPGKSETFFWDMSCRGFGLRTLESGRRSWFFQYRDEHRRTRRIALGDVSAVSLEAAREAARQLAAIVTQGGNPSVQRKKKATAVRVIDIVEDYLKHVHARQRPRSYKETERHLRRHAEPLHHERAEAVHRRDISALLERVTENSGPIAANRLRAALSALWTWGLRTGMIEADSSPVAYTTRRPEKPRQRTLSDAELRAIWTATHNSTDYFRIVRLCLLTGCRREEIGSLQWDEIQGDRLLIGADRMKGRVPHEVAIVPMIIEALPTRSENSPAFVFGRTGTGFSGWSKSKNVLDARLLEAGSKVPAWGLHDLRRTFSTRLHDAGIEPLVVEALLAHKQPGVAAVYNRASFREAKRAALVRWHSMLKEILSPEAVFASCD